MSADRGVSEAGRDRSREHERSHESGRPQEDPLAERQHPAREREFRQRLRAVQAAEDHHQESGAHPELRDRRAPRGPLDPPVEPVDEEHLEYDVHRVRNDDDDERRAQVRDPAQVALPAEREEGRRQPDRGDAEICDRVGRGIALSAHERDERLREHRDEPGDDDAEPEREPDGLGAQPPGRLGLACPACAGDLGGRAVLEEVEDREDAAEDRRGDSERRELRAAEMPDDGRVHEQVERLSGERAQRRNREPEDLAVVR